MHQFSEWRPERAARRHEPSADLDVTTGATAQDARDVRLRCEQWLHRIGAPSELADDLGLAVYEALANVVEHAYSTGERQAMMRLRAKATGDDVLIWVSDRGRWDTGDGTGYRGRGLALIERLVTDTQLETSPQGTTVRLRARLTATADA